MSSIGGAPPPLEAAHIAWWGGWVFKYIAPPLPQQLALAVGGSNPPGQELALAFGGVTTPGPAVGTKHMGGEENHQVY